MPVDLTEYQAFYSNVLKDEEMLREMACDPVSAQAVFDQLGVLTDGHVPVGDFLKLTEAVSKSIQIHSETASHFSDLDILKVYGSYFEKWFQIDGFKEVGAGFGNPVFGAIQEAFTSSTKNNQLFSFEYLITNVDIGEYDVDALDLLIALKEQKIGIIELMYLHADKETYGTKGALKHIMGPAIHDEFRRAQRWLSPEIYEKMKEFSVLADAEQSQPEEELTPPDRYYGEGSPHA